MALLTLKDIGKIYVSEGNVTVGIRGVNLSFDRGEFVAVTGKSGSGKSTLLNVISGMDSYEEGELYIDGQTTSHYLQPEWEEYREKYISFIFQDYNIIESFTVLQNVELALMHIEDKRERRARAMELIRRVGLSSHVKHKGSKLSGGQKQRTVIARALAKDSPIILADEPTGNLDSVTSREIIELLREVSKDKLLIVVTHNFDQVAEFATRHIRVFDGAVESDHVIRESERYDEQSVPFSERKKKAKPSKKEKNKKLFKNGMSLGKTIFTAKPRLSLFLCLLMIIGTMGIFLITSFCGEASELFEPHYMFNNIDGRVVLAKQSGETFTEDEVKELVKKHGAESYLRFDSLLDSGRNQIVTLPVGDSSETHIYTTLNFVYGKDYGTDIVGRYPEKSDEVLLYLPIYYQDEVGKDELILTDISVSRMNLKVTGVKYYYDNNLPAECLLTEEGFRAATAIHYLVSNSNVKMSLTAASKDGKDVQNFEINSFVPSFDMESDKIYVESSMYGAFLKKNDPSKYDVSFNFNSVYYNYNYNYGSNSTSITFEKTFGSEYFTPSKPTVKDYSGYTQTDGIVIISDELLCSMAEEVLNGSYKQVSLFFADDKSAGIAAEKMQDEGYIAVPSYTTYEPDAATVIMSILASIMLVFMWIISIVFLAFFINLCSSRTLGAFKGDMAIMRSMGIQVKVIRIAMYVRMMIALIPAFVLVVLTAVFIFTSPKFNEYFVYLYLWQYALIFIGMIALTVRTTSKQVKKLFDESVKKSLKGGNAE